ncbi:cation:proton antiporter [Granulosicoccus sp.]|nr:cation:proton antiporter [Granulosicoccus sp.]MDB4223318.1 cation:proton antiporter [Granulosicoccus sp.]
MHDTSIIYSLFLVFSGAAVVATIALYARQALLIAYILLGALFGPWALDLVSNPDLIADIANVGILFLLFLLGLNLEPQDLRKLFREAIVVTVASSIAFATLGLVVAQLFGFSLSDSLLIAAGMMFSSTIIALKLLPTSALHHQRMGELIVSILLLQDILAIAVLLALEGLGNQDKQLWESLIAIVGLPALVLAAWWFATRVLTTLFKRFDQIPEYLFLWAIGWCLGLAQLATVLGLSHEIGAFIAGVTLATSPIARFIAESLKPLRDFFLILFFFALGAGFNIGALPDVLLPALILAAMAIALKPMIFRFLLQREQEKASMAGETGARLGQISEFSLLIVVVATDLSIMSEKASLLMQSATILSFIASSFWIVRRYPTPISTDRALHRD